jgi:LmbE family N-acetylglucosaminyl deacetylase
LRKSAATVGGQRDMVVIAHEDDDILFMNPDIQNSIRAGNSVRTVFVTAGDAGYDQTYWAGREAGALAAYAHMVGLPNSWTRSLMTVQGKALAYATLDGSSQVSIIFLRLPDGGGNKSEADSLQLQRLWEGGLTQITAYDGSATYTRSELIAVLLQIMTDYSPTRIRTQESAAVYGSDHTDHTHAARFAFAAHQQLPSVHQLVLYRGYNIEIEPQNVDHEEYPEKRATVGEYIPHDAVLGGNLDYGDGWVRRQYAISSLARVRGPIGLGGGCLIPTASALQLQPCANGPLPVWEAQPSGAIVAPDSRCLERGAGNGSVAPIELSSCSGAAAQLWTVLSNGQIRGLDGWCLGASTDGAVQAAPCAHVADPRSTESWLPDPQQQWTFHMGEARASTPSGEFGDGELGARSSYFATVRLADVDGDGLADACARRPDGVYCAHNNGNGFSAHIRFTDEYSDALGWADEQFGTTLQLGDINGDGKADVCGRGYGGVRCAVANADGTAFVDPRMWSSDFSSGWQDATHYSSIRLTDVNGDRFADLCGRSSDGIVCALNRRDGSFAPATLWVSEFSDALGWVPLEYGSTISFGDIDGDGRTDVCGRGISGILCATGRSVGDGFERVHLWSVNGDLSDAAGWNREAGNYDSFRLADIDGDGRADLCARRADGVVCGWSTGWSFAGVRPVMPRDLTDAAGWLPAKYGATLQWADLDGDGRADVCGRGAGALLCSLTAPTRQ